MRITVSFSAFLLSAIGLGLATPSFAEDRTLTVVAPWELKGLDPATIGYAFTRMEVAETLVGTDTEGRPVAALAESWAASADGLTWTFDLRDGVTFHDDSALTAETVVHSLTVALGKPGVLDKAPIASIAAADGDVVIVLSQPFSPLLSFLSHSSTQILATDAYDEADAVTAIIGTGPYRLVRLEAPQRMEVERFDAYWGEAPQIAKAAFLAVGRGETRALMAESGDADIVFNLDPASIQRLTRSDQVDVEAVPLPRVVSLKVNAGNAMLEDGAVRTALSLAIDRAGIATALLRQPETAASELFPPSMGAWHNGAVEPLGYDPEQAALLLAELGWEAGGDGILVRDGERFSVTLRTYPDRPELPLVATALQDQFRAIGVEMNVAIGNSSEVPAGHQDGTLELALVARNFSLVPDPLGTLSQDFAPEGGDWGAMNWSNAEMTAALDALVASADPAGMDTERKKVTQILHDELPVIPVVWYLQTAAISNQVENVVIDPFEHSYNISSMRWAGE